LASSPIQTLTEHWDGTSWNVATSPNNPAQENVLWGVACGAASDCWAVGKYDVNLAATLTEHYGLPFVQLNSVVSRKTHGGAGTFDVDLPLIGRSGGIESRTGGPNGDYTLVFNFVNPLTSVGSATVTRGIGTIASSSIDVSDPTGSTYLVNLTGVNNAQAISVSLNNVTDSTGVSSSAISTQVGVLLGDVNASGRVDAADVSLVRQQTLQPITSSNFREDINVSGRIDAADVSIVRQETLTSLP
jgi:hypothetical protein